MAYTLQYRIASDIADKVAFEVSKVAARTVDEQGRTKYDLLKIYNSDAQFITDFIGEAIRRILAEYSDIATDAGQVPSIFFKAGSADAVQKFRTSALDRSITSGTTATAYYAWGGTEAADAYYTTSVTPAVSDLCYAYDSEAGTMTARTGAITEYDPANGVDFDVPDFDSAQEERTLDEIERFVVLFTVASWFESRLPEMGKHFAESAEASAIKMLRLIRARKAITR